MAELIAAGLTVDVGLMEAEARRINAPYLKLLSTGRPWIIAKWAMTLDGKIATRTGESRWISNPQSREIVHSLRGRVDAIMVGRETAIHDDPLLTARPLSHASGQTEMVGSNLPSGADIPVCQMRSDSPGRQECLPHLDKPWACTAKSRPNSARHRGIAWQRKPTCSDRAEKPVLMAVGAES